MPRSSLGFEPPREPQGSSPAADLTEAASLPGWQTTEPAQLRRGAMLGRYLILGKIGAGGMGVVYAAYDPELDRKVAVKLLKSGGYDPYARARLLREAQSMAKLSHPNVIAVFDVGTVGDQVFMAMEFIQGATLSRWLAKRRRTWPEVLEVFTAVGRGLACAHAAGLVHRDIKPDNIMLGDDGRVRVMDFGLAHAELRERVEISRLPPHVEGVDLHLTPEGAHLGTPSYMSPEQWQGAAVDARSDQFSLCICIWEAVYGERPFVGETWPALRSAVLAGKIREPREPTRSPKWLRRVLERGLSTAPGRRFTDVDELVAAIARARTGSQRRRLGAGAALVCGLAGGLFSLHRVDHAQRVAACELEGQSLRAEIWSEARQAATRRAFVDSGLNFGESAFEGAATHVDRWIDAWSRVRTDSCVDATVREIRAPELHALSVACLDEKRGEVEALLESFAEGERYAVRSALRAVAKLPALDECESASKLRQRAQLPDDPEVRSRVRELRREIKAIERLRLAGRYREGLARSIATHGQADTLGHVPLQADLMVQHGLVAIEAGRFVEAESALRRAFFISGTAGLDELAVSAAMELAFVIGYRQGRIGEALAWAQSADMLVHHLGQQNGVLGASVASNTGLVYHASGDLVLAQTYLEKTLRIREDQYKGAEHPNIAGAFSNLAEVHAARGELQRARAMQARAYTIREATLGPDHPRVATSLLRLALVDAALGDGPAARVGFERALGIWEQTLGPDHPDVGAALAGLAELALREGRAPEALTLLERAASIIEASGARPDELADLYFVQARALWHAPSRRDPARVIQRAEQAIAYYQAAGSGYSAKLAAVLRWVEERRADAQAERTGAAGETIEGAR